MNFKNKAWDGTTSTHNLQLYCEECGFLFGKHKATALAECPAMPLAYTTQVGAGVKFDSGKSPVRRGLLEYFPRACMAVADVSAAGAKKYTWKGWATVPDATARYGDAEVRHICKAAIEGPTDPDFGCLHAAHEAWNAMARLELVLIESETAK
jgi:hypothetical protein